MRKLLAVLAVTAASLTALAQKETGALEGTVIDQSGRPLQGITVNAYRTGYEGHSRRRLLLRTDKRGHFVFSGLPVGTYSVLVASPDGRSAPKEIQDVRVEAGRVQNLNSALGVFTLPPPTLPAQPNIVRGCITIRSITFQSTNSNPGVSGSIENKCGRDAYVSLDVSFFGASGDMLNDELAEKLVGPGVVDFRVGLSNFTLRFKPDTVYASTGRVTSVSVTFQP